MGIISKIANYLRRSVEREEEIEEPSGGFLSHRIREKALDLTEKGEKLLDVGAGEGLLLKDIEDKGPKILYAIDFKWEFLQKAVNRLKGKRILFILGDGRNLPFRDGIFNEVTLLNLFMNIPDIEIVAAILKESFRVCRVNGKVIFDYRNLMNPWIMLSYKTVSLHDPDIGWPLKAFKRKEIRDVLHSMNISDVIYHSIPSFWKINSPAYLVEAYKRVKP